jgi:transcriptional regulator
MSKKSDCTGSVSSCSCLYVPPHFSSADDELADSIMRNHPFVTFVSPNGDERPFVSHIPIYLQSDASSADKRHRTLLGHVAASSPHAKMLAAGCLSTAIFHGPHAYMSPSVYPPPFLTL